MRSKISILLALSTVALSAQAVHFTDGAATGGSMVFSEGLNPRGNSACFPRAIHGFYLSWAEGDQRTKDNRDALKNLADPAKVEAALRTLQHDAWAERIRTYGAVWATQNVHTSYTREERTGLWVNSDVTASHLGAGISQNTTGAEIRRAVVDRITFGGGEFNQGTGVGVAVRLERWKFGRSNAFLNQAPKLGILDPISFEQTAHKNTTMAMDAGFTEDLLPGLRVGLMVDRLMAKRIHDVEEKPQMKVGIQMDLGATVRLTVESDINKAQRLPFPVRQRASSASLQLTPNPFFSLTLGAARRELEGQSLLTGGATFWVNAGGCRLGAGFQYSQDRPMKSFTAGIQ